MVKVRTWELGNCFDVVGGPGIDLAASFNGGFRPAYCSCFALCAGFGMVKAD